MHLDPAKAAAFAESYGRTWEAWDAEAFAALFSDDVVYVVHPGKVVTGREALRHYFREEQADQGAVAVRIGAPIADPGHVVAEFWVTATNRGEQATFTGCFIARFDPEGRCNHFREYWFNLEGHADPYPGWGSDAGTPGPGPGS